MTTNLTQLRARAYSQADWEEIWLLERELALRDEPKLVTEYRFNEDGASRWLQDATDTERVWGYTLRLVNASGRTMNLFADRAARVCNGQYARV